MNNLYIKEIPGKGRGVFSPKDIKSGEIVEKTPLPLPGISLIYKLFIFAPLI